MKNMGKHGKGGMEKRRKEDVEIPLEKLGCTKKLCLTSLERDVHTRGIR